LLPPILCCAFPLAKHSTSRLLIYAREARKNMIVKRAGKYVVLSETTGRRFGTYATLAEAKKRLRQIEFFKHVKGRTPARRLRRAVG